MTSELEQRDASDDYNDIGSALPRGFSKRSNDNADLRRLHDDRRREQQHADDMRSFFNYYGRIFDSVQDTDMANEVLQAHPILAEAFSRYQNFDFELEPPNFTDYETSKHDEQPEQFSNNYTTCIKCNNIFPCSSSYQGNRPICMTCSAEIQDAQNDDITTSGSPTNHYSRSASPSFYPSIGAVPSRSNSPAPPDSPHRKRQRSFDLSTSSN